MGLRRRRSTLDTFRNDLKQIVDYDGSTIVFSWTEITGGVWNETYEIWEGGTETQMTHSIRGLGKVVKTSDEVVEYEWGRIEQGQVLIRFPYDADLSQFEGKTNLRFYFLGRKWQLDSPLNAASYHNDEIYAKYIKGIKALD